MDKATKTKAKLKIMKTKRKEKEQELREINERKLQWQGNKKINNSIINKILTKTEQLNVDIAVNRHYFRENYIQNLQKLMNDDDNRNTYIILLIIFFIK